LVRKVSKLGFWQSFAYLLGICSSSISSHVENDVLQTSSLSNLPMNTSASADRHGSNVNDKVTNLSVEIILFKI
jgi:hypothetical protein